MKLAFIDLETTGLDFDVHVVLDVGIVIVDLNVFDKMHVYTACITCDAHDWTLADPEALLVNGFTPGNTRCSKKDWEVGKEIEEFLIKHGIVKGKAFFMCQNPSFDRPFFLQLMSQDRMDELDMPYHWLDLASMYFIKFYASLYPIPNPDLPFRDFCYELSLSKDLIAKSLGLPPEQKPHKALNGAIHLMKCYMACVKSSYCTPPVI